MQLATGTVVGGKVFVQGDPLSEGAVITTLAWEADETFAKSSVRLDFQHLDYSFAGDEVFNGRPSWAVKAV